MKACLLRAYGPPDVLRIEDVEMPVVGDSEVLIRVRAASLNPLDWHTMRGEPYAMRMASGFRRPKDVRFGSDVAGVVEAVGAKVARFKPGDAVFGACRGALAEYACARESALVIKPERITFEQAGAVAVAALTALQGLRDKGRLRAGHAVLVNGAAGGVGTFAVQIAKAFGAHVVGVCSTRNTELVRSIGADRVIDYAHEDFIRQSERYDVVLDCIGNHPLSSCLNVLTKEGRYVVVGAPNGRWLGGVWRLLHGALRAAVLRQPVAVFLTRPSPQDLETLRALFDAGQVTPVIDRCYPFADVADAIGHLETGHARGKVVITIGP